jgi:hypothetical protein
MYSNIDSIIDSDRYVWMRNVVEQTLVDYYSKAAEFRD